MVAHRQHHAQPGGHFEGSGGFGTLFGGRPRPVAHLGQLRRAAHGATRDSRALGNPCARMDVESLTASVVPTLSARRMDLRPGMDTVGNPSRESCLGGRVLECRTRMAGSLRSARPWLSPPWPNHDPASHPGGTRPVGQPDPWPHLATILPGRRTHRCRVAQRMGGRRPSPSSPHTKTSLARTTCIVPSSSVARFSVAPSP